MMQSPAIRAALWNALRPLTWGWGSALAVLLLLLVGLMWMLEQQNQQWHQLQRERDDLAAQHAQAQQDHDLALQYQPRYRAWLRDGLLSEEPLPTWRALQLQKILDWLSAQPDWLQRSVEIELQSAQPWTSAQNPADAPPAPAPAAGDGQPSSAPTLSAQTLRVSGNQMHDIEAWGVVHQIQHLLGSVAALQQCHFKTERGSAAGGAASPSAEQAVASIEWECRWTLFYMPRAAPASGSGQP